jgi:hypothetical protein
VQRIALILNPDDVAMSLAESIVNLVDERSQTGICPVTEEYAERIEAIAQRARHAEEPNSATGKIDSHLSELAFHLGTKRCCGSITVVRVVKTEHIWPIMREPSQPARKFSEFIEIEQQPKDSIAETVSWLHSAMHY